MRNDHVAEPFRSILNEAVEAKPDRIIIERGIPTKIARYRWWAYYDGQEDNLSRSGATPIDALANFLTALDDEP